MATAHIEAPRSPLRYGLYCRISSDDEGDALGVKRQIRDVTALVTRLGGVVSDSPYIENDVSASSERFPPRPEFDRLLADLATGAIDRIAVANQERLVRRPEELEAVMRLHQRLGVPGVETLSGSLDFATSRGRKNARYGAVDAKAYAEVISELVVRKKVELAEAGLPSGGGPRPFGYQPGGLKLDRTEAALIKRAAADLLAGKTTVIGIARDWTTKGVSTVTGKPWRPNVVKNILRSPRIAGLREYRGDVVGQAVWPAIITEADHQKLVALFAGRQRSGGRPATTLLSGIAVCSICKKAMVSRTNNKKPAYGCTTGEPHFGCGRTAVVAAPVDEIITTMAVDQLQHNAALAAWVYGGGDDQDNDGVAAAVAEDEDTLRQLAADFAERIITRGEWIVAREIIEKRLAENRRRLRPQKQATVLRDLIGHGERFLKLPMDQKRAALRVMLLGVEIARAPVRGRRYFDPSRVDPRWRF